MTIWGWILLAVTWVSILVTASMSRRTRRIVASVPPFPTVHDLNLPPNRSVGMIDRTLQELWAVRAVIEKVAADSSEAKLAIAGIQQALLALYTYLKEKEVTTSDPQHNLGDNFENRS